MVVRLMLCSHISFLEKRTAVLKHTLPDDFVWEYLVEKNSLTKWTFLTAGYYTPSFIRKEFDFSSVYKKLTISLLPHTMVKSQRRSTKARVSFQTSRFDTEWSGLVIISLC